MEPCVIVQPNGCERPRHLLAFTASYSMGRKLRSL